MLHPAVASPTVVHPCEGTKGSPFTQPLIKAYLALGAILGAGDQAVTTPSGVPTLPGSAMVSTNVREEPQALSRGLTEPGGFWPQACISDSGWECPGLIQGLPLRLVKAPGSLKVGSFLHPRGPSREPCQNHLAALTHLDGAVSR